MQTITTIYLFEYQNLTILHLGTSIARLCSVEPTHLTLKCQDLENYFKPPWLSVACAGVCAWRLRHTTRRGKAALSLVGIFGPVWLLPSTSLASSRQRFRPPGLRERKCDYFFELTPRSDGCSRLCFDRFSNHPELVKKSHPGVASVSKAFVEVVGRDSGGIDWGASDQISYSWMCGSLSHPLRSRGG